MNVSVLNFSPKGNHSITLQYSKFIAKHYINDKFEFINIGSHIKNGTPLQDISHIMQCISKSDLIMFAYPVYNCLPPSHLFEFFELLSEEQKNVFNGKCAVQLTTSKHSFDNFAHMYVDLLCADLRMKTCKGFSADLDDLMHKDKQKELLQYWEYVHMIYDSSSFDTAYSNNKVLPEHYKKVSNASVKKDSSRQVVIVSDHNLNDEEHKNSSLTNMVNDFIDIVPYSVKLINLSDYIDKGCYGCLSCCPEGKCVQKDGFQQMHESVIKNADAIIFAGKIKNHYLGSLFKKYDEREYYNGNRTLGKVKTFGYIISGNYSQEYLLQNILNARSEQHFATFAGVATDEHSTYSQLVSLCNKISYCVENSFVQPGGFYKNAKINAFKNLISDMRGVMKKDYGFFKENGFFYNPVKSLKKIVGMGVIGSLSKVPKIGEKIMEGFSDASSDSQKKIVKDSYIDEFINPYKKKRILLIAPELKIFTDAPPLPIGLLSIGTYLSNKNYTVKVVNRSVKKENLKKLLAEFKPDIVGVSVISVQTLKDSISISKAVKKEGKPVVWGGPLASAIPEVALKEDYVDFVVIGEGEQTWLELVEKFDNNDFREIDGLAFKENGKTIINGDRKPLLNSEIPVINYNLIDINRYPISHFDCERMIWISAGKGCPNNCSFCYNKDFHKCKYRKRPIDDVLDEIRYLSENYGIDGVSFADELFFKDKHELRYVCDKIRDSKIDFVWGCFLRVGEWDKEDFEYMYQSGCRWILFGIESGSESTLKRIHKGISLSEIEPTIIKCYEAGISPWASFIIGLPDETVDELKKTIELGKKLAKYRCRVSFNYFTPVIGSDLYKELVKSGRKPELQNLNDLCGSAWNNLYENYSQIPTRDLKVLSACGTFWSAGSQFFNKEANENKNIIWWVTKVIKVIINNYRKHGIRLLINWLYSMAITFIPAAVLYTSSTKIKRKYEI